MTASPLTHRNDEISSPALSKRRVRFSESDEENQLLQPGKGQPQLTKSILRRTHDDMEKSYVEFEAIEVPPAGESSSENEPRQDEGKRVHFDLEKNTFSSIEDTHSDPSETTWYTAREYQELRNELALEVKRLRNRLKKTTSSGWYDDCMVFNISQQESRNHNADNHSCNSNSETDTVDTTSSKPVKKQEDTVRGLETLLRRPTQRDSKYKRRASLVAAVMREQRKQRFFAKTKFSKNKKMEYDDNTRPIAEASKLRTLRDRRVALQIGRADAEFVRRLQ